MRTQSSSSTQPSIYFVILLAIFLSFVVLSVVGYYGYLQYAASNVAKVDLLPPLIFYAFAFFSGVVSFFAPCAIGILPAYLSYYLNVEESGEKNAVYYGAIAASGLILFYLILGLLIIIFGQVIGMTLMSLNREISAAILFLVGLFLLFNMSINVKRIVPHRIEQVADEVLGQSRHESGLFCFGIFYGLEAFMCALLLMMPLIIYPLLGGAVLTSIISFVTFSFALGLCMVLTTILISRSKRILTERFMATTQSLKTIAGIVMILTAAYILYTIVMLPSMPLSGMDMGAMDGGPGMPAKMEMKK